MKKALLVFLTTLLAVLMLGILCGKMSLQTAEKMGKITGDIMTLSGEGDFASARAEWENLHGIWEKREPLLQMWTVHEDTDMVSLLLEKLRLSLLQQNSLHSVLTAGELFMSIEHLYHRDAPHVKNIF